jgi:hypothetical protein
MRLARRLVAALLAVLGTTGTILCVAAVVGVWILHADLVGRADRVFGRVGDRLGAMRADLGRAADRLRQAGREVGAVEKREDTPAREKRHPALPKAAAQSASAQLGQARQAVVTATEVGLVAGGVLDVLAELPLAERVGLDTARLRDAADQLSDLIRTADQVAAALPRGPDEPDESSPGLADRVGRVATTIDDTAGRLDEARARVADWHRRTVRALTLAAAAATALLVWVGLGQVCLAAQGLRRAVPRPATSPRTA